MSVREVPTAELIKKAAEELKKKGLEQPAWAKYSKTGAHRERRPDSQDWWWTRAASVLRKVYIDGPVGVSKLRTVYGGRKHRGHKPEHHYRGSGSVARTILQQLEKEGLVKLVDKPRKGRVITPKGQKFLDQMAKECSKA